MDTRVNEYIESMQGSTKAERVQLALVSLMYLNVFGDAKQDIKQVTINEESDVPKQKKTRSKKVKEV